MKDTMEHPEEIKAGTLKLVGTDKGVIYNELPYLLNDAAADSEMSHASDPCGDGHACEKIADALEAE